MGLVGSAKVPKFGLLLIVLLAPQRLITHCYAVPAGSIDCRRWQPHRAKLQKRCVWIGMTWTWSPGWGRVLVAICLFWGCQGNPLQHGSKSHIDGHSGIRELISHNHMQHKQVRGEMPVASYPRSHLFFWWLSTWSPVWLWTSRGPQRLVDTNSLRI